MKKIAIIGASYLQEPIVRKAKEMGLYTICFAWREGATCANICDKFYPVSITEKEEILRICKEEDIDAICTIASDTAVIAVNHVAAHMGLIANDDCYSVACTNKYAMRQCFMKSNVPSPKYALATPNIPIDLTGFQFPLIVKPTDRSGSRGVEKIISSDSLNAAIARAQEASFSHEAIIEEFVDGQEISVESISYKGQHYILQITDKVTTGAPYFVELAHHQPSSLPEETQSRVKSIVIDALNALHIEYGASHSELKITPSGDVKVIEVGARMGGDFIGSNLVQLSTGYDFLKGVIDVALGTFEKPQITEHNYSGVYFLCKETERLKEVILNAKNYSAIVEARITDGSLHAVQCSGDRSGYAIYKSDKRIEFGI
ncbi:MAG: ATP-grasp domain-containing protein [Muribaculaceae bacterium]|nr:ATP-grasp domain-containing protein [Muribaculaceae bacterium]